MSAYKGRLGIAGIGSSGINCAESPQRFSKMADSTHYPAPRDENRRQGDRGYPGDERVKGFGAVLFAAVAGLATGDAVKHKAEQGMGDRGAQLLAKAAFEGIRQLMQADSAA